EWGSEARAPPPRPRCGTGRRHGKPGLESTKVRVALNALGFDRFAKRVGLERQDAGARESPEQHGVRLGAVLARERQRVEGDEALREGARRGLQLVDRIDAASGHDLLVD